MHNLEQKLLKAGIEPYVVERVIYFGCKGATKINFIPVESYNRGNTDQGFLVTEDTGKSKIIYNPQQDKYMAICCMPPTKELTRYSSLYVSYLKESVWERYKEKDSEGVFCLYKSPDDDIKVIVLPLSNTIKRLMIRM